MWEFEHWRHRISLHRMANLLGLGSSKLDGLDGAAVYDFFLQDRHREIAVYCLRDVEMARAVYYKMCYEPAPEARPLAESVAARS